MRRDNRRLTALIAMLHSVTQRSIIVILHLSSERWLRTQYHMYSLRKLAILLVNVQAQVNHGHVQAQVQACECTLVPLYVAVVAPGLAWGTRQSPTVVPR